MELKYMEHKHGGKITEIRKVAHATEKGAPAFWFYEGSVQWEDGSKSDHVEIAPWAICYDHAKPEADAEYDKLSNFLSEYLRTAGSWNGRMWKPKSKFGHLELS